MSLTHWDFEFHLNPRFSPPGILFILRVAVTEALQGEPQPQRGFSLEGVNRPMGIYEALAAFLLGSVSASRKQC